MSPGDTKINERKEAARRRELAAAPALKKHEQEEAVREKREQKTRDSIAKCYIKYPHGCKVNYRSKDTW